MHEIQVHPVMSENQFHCTRLYVQVQSFCMQKVTPDYGPVSKVRFNRQYVMRKPSRCWLGAVPRYWNVAASCFPFISFAENTSAALAPRAGIFQPILLLFFCFLPLEFVYKMLPRIFLIRSQNLVALKRRQNWLKRGYFRTFPKI